MEHEHARSTPFDLKRVTVRGETRKVRKTRKLVVEDFGYYLGVMRLKRKVSGENVKEKDIRVWLGE